MRQAQQLGTSAGVATLALCYQRHVCNMSHAHVLVRAWFVQGMVWLGRCCSLLHSHFHSQQESRQPNSLIQSHTHQQKLLSTALLCKASTEQASTLNIHSTGRHSTQQSSADGHNRRGKVDDEGRRHLKQQPPLPSGCDRRQPAQCAGGLARGCLQQ